MPAINTISLRQLLDRQGMTCAPGAYDAIGAQMIEHAGFEAVYMTGGATSMAHGYPDYGLLDLSEMATQAGVLARSTRLPVIADADTGYGNELNVTRTVREYEMRGVAGLHIEDQVSPKRCGHLDGKHVISRGEFVSKVRAAVSARRSRDFIIIARTDARAMIGLDEAILRANEALAAGADMAFVEAAQSIEEVAAIPQRVKGPCLLNVVPGGRTPVTDMHAAEAMGYKLAILPGLLFAAFVEAGDAALAQFKSSLQATPSKIGIAQVFKRFGSGEWDALRRSFAATEADAP